MAHSEQQLESSTSLTPSSADTVCPLQDPGRSMAADDLGLLVNRMLSSQSASSPSSLSIANQDEPKILCCLGAGTCGTVFEWIDKRFVVKYSDNPPMLASNAQLWNEFIQHRAMNEALELVQQRGLGPVSFKVSGCFGLLPKTQKGWWDSHMYRFPERYRKPGHLLISERIISVPQFVRHAIINGYCPERLREAAKKCPGNDDALIRLYLGKRREIRNSNRPSLMFSLRNYGLHLNQMEEMNIGPSMFAGPMAEVLAVMHWIARVDAGDIEVVLGTSVASHEFSLSSTSEEIENMQPYTSTAIYTYRPSALHVWVLDFNRCQPIMMDELGVNQAVKVFFINDPYFPRPPLHTDGQGENRVWELFETRYLEFSRTIIEELIQNPSSKGEMPTDALGLPGLFLTKVEEEWSRRVERIRAAENRAGDVLPP
ncbi:MAG: hypothetical protein Q9225_007671 [Loekoesia sp. 1 TL-2023]